MNFISKNRAQPGFIPAFGCFVMNNKEELALKDGE
jgi:hypothetical protein